MPVRDYQRRYLERALASILGQTASGWRLLVIDDGADGGLERILTAVDGDARVRAGADQPAIAGSAHAAKDIRGPRMDAGEWREAGGSGH